MKQPVERRLAAIFAVDVAGYSRFMGADEEGTHERLKGHFRKLVEPKIKEHRGRTVKNTGDGMLVEFSSVVDAVRCAVEIQRAMVDRNADLPAGERIELRIGINLGDIIADGRDIYGDGVNIAARLEALAEPGAICISRVVRDQIRDKLTYPFQDMGEQTVKNIARPVRAYLLSAAALAALPPVTASARPRSTRRHAQPRRTAPRLSIVVLPFTNLSNDPEQEYFADGITDDLTSDLSRIAGSFVIARTTAFTYKGKPVDVRQIGRELGVHYVLEGSVRRLCHRVQVNAQLIEAPMLRPTGSTPIAAMSRRRKVRSSDVSRDRSILNFCATQAAGLTRKRRPIQMRATVSCAPGLCFTDRVSQKTKRKPCGNSSGRSRSIRARSTPSWASQGSWWELLVTG